MGSKADRKASLIYCTRLHACTHMHTHTFVLQPSGLCPGLFGWASTRTISILLKQETVSCNGISWAICKSAPHSRLIIMLAPHHSVFYRPYAFPATQA